MAAFLFRYAIQRAEKEKMTVMRRYLCMILEGADRETVAQLVHDWTHTRFPSTIVPDGWEYIPQTSPLQELTC